MYHSIEFAGSTLGCHVTLLTRLAPIFKSIHFTRLKSGLLHPIIAILSQAAAPRKVAVALTEQGAQAQAEARTKTGKLEHENPTQIY